MEAILKGKNYNETSATDLSIILNCNGIIDNSPITGNPHEPKLKTSKGQLPDARRELFNNNNDGDLDNDEKVTETALVIRNKDNVSNTALFTINEDKVSETSLAMKSIDEIATALVTSKTKRKVCCFPGCKQSSDEEKIVNHACKLHIEEVRKRNSKRRKLNYHKHKGAANAEFDFDLRKYASDVNFLKTLSFSRDYVIPAAIKKGELISLTESFKTPYDALRKTGVAFYGKQIKHKRS